MAASSSFLFLSIFLSYSLLIDGQSPGDLRLIRNGVSRLSYSYGRLQIYASTGWGEVCGDNFNITERNVACHQLGYSSSLNNDTINSYGSDVGSVFISEVNCYDNSEYLHLLRCFYRKGFDTCQQNFVTLYCNSTNNPPYDGQLRLLYGTTSSNGLVQVYCSGQWGTVCGRYFTPDAAHLVCRQLGYTSAKSYSNGTL
ncbi:PREDICTED: neurotrypsin-like [Amphimedon queenslandica]|uniref:SRCR domain-containing protein n=1 Tax=Amphimedon queenslandica TaxID=400682 RepID=A0A1X7U5H7_AMPQE|nr:PREDICTED: neurotrypsin-like [Amphimedon queenslandica]|eukprot:XP_011406026.2 PREDICTED: neurotrypsin-like [Amphimedon queenslandica]